MPDFLLFMHDDATAPVSVEAWGVYFSSLRSAGRFQGGSAIGEGACVRKTPPAPALTPRLMGFIRIEADDLAHARSLVVGNPVFEAGGTVEIRELPKTD